MIQKWNGNHLLLKHFKFYTMNKIAVNQSKKDITKRINKYLADTHEQLLIIRCGDKPFAAVSLTKKSARSLKNAITSAIRDEYAWAESLPVHLWNLYFSEDNRTMYITATAIDCDQACEEILINCRPIICY